MPGPPPTPTALKIMRGNPGKRALNHSEPQPGEFKDEPPDYLDEIAIAEWNRRVPILLGMRVLTAADYGQLAKLCVYHSIARKALADVEQRGQIVPSPQGEKANPSWKIFLDASEAENRIDQQFGGSPASRSRVKAASEPPKSDWDDLDRMRSSG